MVHFHTSVTNQYSKTSDLNSSRDFISRIASMRQNCEVVYENGYLQNAFHALEEGKTF